MARFAEVDAVRGLALLGICVVNIPFLAHPIEALQTPPEGADRVAQLIVEWLFQGKFFVLFSFLFGWGFAVQMASADRAGVAGHGRFVRRLLGLGLIGGAHATLVFFGDILVLYALLGLPLLALHRVSARRLMGLAVGAVVVGALALLIVAAEVQEPMTPLPGAYAGPGYLGTFQDGVAKRLEDWLQVFPFIALFNGPIAFAAFCAGLAASKVGFFEPRNTTYQGVARRLPLLLGIGLVLNLFYALSVDGALGTGPTAALAFASLAVGGPMLAVVYLIGTVELARRGALSASTLAAGRMSLTAYVLEGLLAGLIFNGYGLGLYGSVGALGCLAIAVVIYATTHSIAAFWLARFAQGPLEVLLRAITHGPVLNKGAP